MTNTIRRLASRQNTTSVRLFEILDRCAWAKEALQCNSQKPKLVQEKKPIKEEASTSKLSEKPKARLNSQGK
ncbi:hypothetical protein E2562_026303 [Oryza meyeriana var. granulata]|uniref:Uncharacterized protein n=1 Tax=Oryza meyeriana var. granulata TaxID=110450 RepID=A0A6G1C8X1_9ORYZ|nr:hypothetical protein E2562_026303 [Oryza meyeriana var. granulata]